MKLRSVLIPVTASVMLAACVSVPTGPNVMVLPGSQKSLEQFNADSGNCRQYAQTTLGGADPAQAAANSAVAGAVIGAAAGALIGAATGQAGQAAAIGAGTGLLFGGAAGSNAAGQSYYQAQRRYDVAYMQCMYARGNQIPGRRVVYTGAASGYPPANYPPPSGMAPPTNAAPGYPPPGAPPPYPGATRYPPRGTPPPDAGAPYPPPGTPPPTGSLPPPG
jgi:Glycine-zipper domain